MGVPLLPVPEKYTKPSEQLNRLLQQSRRYHPRCLTSAAATYFFNSEFNNSSLYY